MALLQWIPFHSAWNQKASHRVKLQGKLNWTWQKHGCWSGWFTFTFHSSVRLLSGTAIFWMQAKASCLLLRYNKVAAVQHFKENSQMHADKLGPVVCCVCLFISCVLVSLSNYLAVCTVSRVSYVCLIYLHWDFYSLSLTFPVEDIIVRFMLYSVSKLDWPEGTINPLRGRKITVILIA